MKDIKILGAGLSGLTAAINLVRSGYRVDVYERNLDVGVRFHGDLQGLENWSEKADVLEELKGMNVGLGFDNDPFSKVILTNCSKAREISSERPMFYLVKRGSFLGTIDHSMKLQALKAGVNIHFQKTLPPTEADVVATGPFPREIVGVVRGIAFRTSLKDVAIVAFNDRLAFKGYSYLLVTKGYGCMCAVVRRDEMSRANEYLEETKEFFVKQLNLDTQPSKQVGGVGSFSLKNVRDGNTLYAGEAAGLQDFLWGFGMRYAITSGYLAAQSIISNGDYEKTVKNHFGNKMKSGVVNRYLMENVLCKKDYSILINSEVLNRNLYSMHRYNALQRTVYPLAILCLQRTYPKLKP